MYERTRGPGSCPSISAGTISFPTTAFVFHTLHRSTGCPLRTIYVLGRGRMGGLGYIDAWLGAGLVPEVTGSPERSAHLFDMWVKSRVFIGIQGNKASSLVA
jgi:hypothetical protein